MIRDTRQRASVSRALCSLAGLHDLWTHNAPTAGAVELGRPGPSLLSPGQRVLVGWAWDVWDSTGPGSTTVADAIRHLQPAQLAAVAELLTALAEGPDAVDRWLARYAPPALRLTTLTTTTAG
jgi:hypothetical protein